MGKYSGRKCFYMYNSATGEYEEVSWNEINTLTDEDTSTNENTSVDENTSINDDEQKEEKQKPNPVFVPRHIAHRKKRW